MGCGSASFNTLPVHPSAVDRDQDCCFFTPLTLSEPCTSFLGVAADTNMFAAYDAQGRGWWWGKSRHVGDVPSIPTPFLVSEFKVCDVSVGEDFAAFLLSHGSVYFRGRWSSPPDQRLQLEKRIIQIECCHRTVLALCEDGSIWSSGDCLTNGHGKQISQWKRVESILSPVTHVALGSRHGACITDQGAVYVWGDGQAGNLGLGCRRKFQSTPVQLDGFGPGGEIAVHVSCTRGQIQPKRTSAAKAGQEGPRMHIVTDTGRLYISGTTHKGLGADHLSKTFMPEHDLLKPYLVGSEVKDWEKCGVPRVPTGAAEDIRSNCALARCRMGMALKGPDPQMSGYLSNVHICTSQPVHIHSIALDTEGHIFSWGCGSNGRTGLKALLRGQRGSKRRMKCYVSTPSRVESLEDRQALFATAGKYWSLVIMEPGKENDTSGTEKI